MRISTTQQAAPGTRFAAGAFTSRIGKHVPLRLDGELMNGDVLVVDAVVAPDGLSVEFTCEVTLSESESPQVAPLIAASMPGSFSLPAPDRHN